MSTNPSSSGLSASDLAAACRAASKPKLNRSLLTNRDKVASTFLDGDTEQGRVYSSSPSVLTSFQRDLESAVPTLDGDAFAQADPRVSVKRETPSSTKSCFLTQVFRNSQ